MSPDLAEATVAEPPPRSTRRSAILPLIAFLCGLYLFLLALDGFKVSWRLFFSVDEATRFVTGNVGQMLEHPLVGFCLGILVTSLIQSSSATIAIIISFVAAHDAPVALCIPIILGANIGTTVTNTLVGLGHSFDRDEFRRVVPAALVDDIFKLMNISLFMVLELAFGVLTSLSKAVVSLFPDISPAERSDPLLPDFVGQLTEPIIGPWSDLGEGASPGLHVALVSGLVAFVLLLLGLRLMGDAMQRIFQSSTRAWIRRSLGHPVRGALVGFVSCWLLQSSSVTTSLMIPLVAKKVATLRNAYHVAIGASVGTTADAGQLLSYVKYGVPGLAAGVVHIAVNLVGAVLFMSIPVLRALPVTVARSIGSWLGDKRYAPLIFGALVLATFFGVPLAIFMIGRTVA